MGERVGKSRKEGREDEKRGKVKVERVRMEGAGVLKRVMKGEEGKEGRLKKRRAVNREKGQIPWNSDCFSTWTCENHLRRKLPKALWKAE